MVEKYYIAPSEIHGEGVFSKKELHKNEDIDIGIKYHMLNLVPYVTPEFGSMINHSSKPNSYLKYKKNQWYVTASKNIPKDTEILLNYHNTPWFIQGPDPSWS